jgi:hypothetical protein
MRQELAARRCVISSGVSLRGIVVMLLIEHP